uniref:Nucleoside diphosphate kinase B n=1 Tax=Fundulus heteroclitus TaxID=8078 RepID=A0A3Q2Q9D9_FUNHE
MAKSEELTFIAIKPDGVQRGIIGEIIKRFEMKGFKLVGMKMLEASEDLLMESGPVVTGRVTQLMKSKKCIFVFVSLIQRHEGLNVSVLQPATFYHPPKNKKTTTKKRNKQTKKELLMQLKVKTQDCIF